MDFLANLCCVNKLTLLEEFILSKEGTSFVLPFPEEWRVTFHSLETIPEISKEDIEEIRNTYLCCEKTLIVVGVLHHVKKSTCRGPILLQGDRGHLYVYNGFFDKSLYYVSSNLQDFFLVGLKFFYPIYELCDFIVDFETGSKIVEHSKSFSDMIIYRDENINVCFILKSSPYKTYTRFCRLPMTPYTDQDLHRWKRVIRCNIVDVLFCVKHNVFGKWFELVIIFDVNGKIFGVDDEQIIFLAHNITEFLKIGCLRFNENRRLHGYWFERTNDVRNVEEELSRQINCPWGNTCKRKKRNIFKQPLLWKSVRRKNNSAHNVL